MKSNYRERIADLLGQAYPKLAAKHRLEFKNVFGAVGGYVNGRIFVTCGKFGFALRLPSETLRALFPGKGGGAPEVLSEWARQERVCRAS